MKRGIKVTIIATWHKDYGRQGVIIGGVADKDGVEYLIGLTTGETTTARDNHIEETRKGKKER